jgi:hypothetical protein
MEDKDLILIKRYISNLLAISFAKSFIKDQQELSDPLIPISEEVANQILSVIKPIIEKCGVFEGCVYIDTRNMDNPFFDYLKVNLQYIEDRVPCAEVKGSYNPNDSIIIDGKFYVTIDIISIGQNYKFTDKFRRAIIRELVHAYDYYMDTINSKYGLSYIKCESESIIDRSMLDQYLVDGDSIEGKLASVVSFILRSEKEDEQIRFLGDVLRVSRLRLLEEPIKLRSHVIKTDFYKNMTNIRDRLTEIENLGNEDEKIKATKTFNDIYKNKSFSYEEMCAYLHKQWNQRKNELFKHVTKWLVDETESLVENCIRCSRFIWDVYERYGPVV